MTPRSKIVVVNIARKLYSVVEIFHFNLFGVEKLKRGKEIHKPNNCNKIKSNKLLKLFCFSNFSINSFFRLQKYFPFLK